VGPSYGGSWPKASDLSTHDESASGPLMVATGIRIADTLMVSALKRTIQMLKMIGMGLGGTVH